MTTFVDTNVLMYAYDEREAQKSPIARALVTDLWRTRDGVLSTQILGELYVNLVRKPGSTLSPSRAAILVRRYTRWRIHLVTATDVLDAIALARKHTLSFWDALIIVAAARAGADRLLSEDMQHGRTIAGVTIVNPFVT